MLEQRSKIGNLAGTATWGQTGTSLKLQVFCPVSEGVRWEKLFSSCRGAGGLESTFGIHAAKLFNKTSDLSRTLAASILALSRTSWTKGNWAES